MYSDIDLALGYKIYAQVDHEKNVVLYIDICESGGKTGMTHHARVRGKRECVYSRFIRELVTSLGCEHKYVIFDPPRKIN